MSGRAKLLIVEDDPSVRDELEIYLTHAGYRVEAVRHFPALAVELASVILEAGVDLVLLDVNLPAMSGLTVCEEIRRSSQLPVIFVTGNNTSMDELNCIVRGGDDYVAKPYQLPVLMARIAAVLRRTMGKRESGHMQRVYKGVMFDAAAAQISKDGSRRELTKNELKLLSCLYQHQGEIVSRADLLDDLWEHEAFIDDNALSVNITRLRNKLSEIGAPDFIETKRGLGYRI